MGGVVVVVVVVVVGDDDVALAAALAAVLGAGLTVDLEEVVDFVELGVEFVLGGIDSDLELGGGGVEVRGVVAVTLLDCDLVFAFLEEVEEATDDCSTGVVVVAVVGLASISTRVSSEGAKATVVVVVAVVRVRLDLRVFPSGVTVLSES